MLEDKVDSIKEPTPKVKSKKVKAVISKKKEYKPKLRPRIVYDNAQREFKSVIRDGKSYYLVMHKNTEVYLGEDLNIALEKYNTVGIKEIIQPPVVEKKKSAKVKTTKDL